MIDFTQVKAGDMIQLRRTSKLPSLAETTLEEWSGEVVEVPADTPLLVVSIEKGSTTRVDWWKTYLLFGNKLVFYSDHANGIEEMFERSIRSENST